MPTAGRPRRRRRSPSPRVAGRLVAVAALVAGALVVPLTPGSPTAHAVEDCGAPLVRETMVSQGLPSYTALARNKRTVVKYFLSMPVECESLSQYITVTGGRLTAARDGMVVGEVDLPTQSHGPVPTFVAAPSTSSTGNAAFVIDGDELGGLTDQQRYTLTFSARIDYVVTTVTLDGHIPGPETALHVPSVQREVDVPANPLRLLVVPMGDADKSFDTSFPTAARGALDAAMVSLARMLPVADGVDRLSSTTAGLRYDVAPSTDLLDLGGHDHDADATTADVDWMQDGKYCGNGVHFTYIARKLGEAREKWNEANGGAPAARVLGVVWNDVSAGASTDEEDDTTADGGCVEGYANVNGTLAWSRLVDAHPTNTAQSGGALSAMELVHTFGAVPNAASGYHSLNSQADGTAVDRAYDNLRGTHVAPDKSIMRYDFDAWHDDNTLLEATDWAHSACRLTTNPMESFYGTGCEEAGTVSAALAEGASEHLHLAGHTDGTPEGTRAHSYVGSTSAVDSTDPLSPYQLVYLDGQGEEVGQRKGVRVVATRSQHVHDGALEGQAHPQNTSEDSLVGIFDVAIATPPGAVQFQLVKAGSPDVVLYGRTKDQRPTVTSVRPVGGAGAAEAHAPSLTEPVTSLTSLSADGSLVAWTSGRDVHVRRADDTTSVPLVIPGAAQPAFSHASDQLAYRSPQGEIHVVTLDTATQVPMVGSHRVVWDRQFDELGHPLPDSLPPAENPSWSPDEQRLVIDTDGVLAVFNAVDGCSQLAVGGCAVLDLQNTASASDPSWSTPTKEHPEGRIAYTDSYLVEGYDADGTFGIPHRDVRVVDVTDMARNGLAVSGGEEPEWGDALLAYTAFPGSGVEVVEGVTFTRVHTTTSTSRSGSVARTDGLVAYVDEEPDTGRMVYLQQFGGDTGGRVVEADDDRPQDLRLDVVGVCAGASYPLMTNVAPISTTSTGAVFAVEPETAALCAGGSVRFDVTDGYQIAERYTDTTLVGTNATPTSTVVSPRHGETFLQHRAVPLALNGRDSAGAHVPVSYTVTGPGATARQGVLPAGERLDLDPFAVPGSYTVTATTTDASGATSSATSVFTVEQDQDADGLPARIDNTTANPCLPLHADQDPRTALADYDGDRLVGPDDLEPCTSSLNAMADFDANTIQPLSNGAKVTVYLTSTSVDLRQFAMKDVAITRLAGHHVQLPALKYEVDLAGRATAQFDRQEFHDLLIQHGLKGYIPVLVTGTTSNASFGGIDPADPTVK